MPPSRLTGMIQAKKTAERLLELDLPIIRIVHSSMTRAKCTAELLAKTLVTSETDGGCPVEECDLLCEGAPLSPEPPMTNWEPNPKVSVPTYSTRY